MAIQISVDLERVAIFCRRHHIRTLAVFGSVLREDFRPESDVDVLVHFEDELSSIVGRRVDLNTSGFLGRCFRQRVLNEAQVLYAT